jgi:hypothetical protein
MAGERVAQAGLSGCLRTDRDHLDQRTDPAKVRPQACRYFTTMVATICG